MSEKLDQSLDQIVKDRRTPNRRTVRGRRVTKPTTKVATPAGGVSKNAKVPKSTKANKATVAAAATTTNNNSRVPAKGESKIVVTGLPSDVTEQQIKEYFAKTIGPVKRAMLTYGPTGQSRGVATIIFHKSGSAVEAASQLNGVKVDNRAMKIEVVLGANQAPAVAPTKGLGDRIAQPKAQGKATTKVKEAAKAAAKSAVKAVSRKGRPAKRGRNTGRGKPKTAQELDAEMTDYFGEGAIGTGVNGQENAAVNEHGNGGDTGMEDEIM